MIKPPKMNLFLVFTEKNKLFKMMNKYKKIAKNKNETVIKLIHRINIMQNYINVHIYLS